MMTGQLTRITADFHDNSPDENSKRTFEKFRSELVKLAASGQYDQILSGMVYLDPGRESWLIQVIFEVGEPLSKSVRQADEIVEAAAKAAGVQITDSGSEFGDMVSYDPDGITLVPA